MTTNNRIQAAKLGYTIISILLCVLGVVLIIVPDFSASLLCWLGGLLLVLFGLIKIAGYCSKGLYRLTFQYDLALGILLIALRKQEAIMVYGSYALLEPDSESLYVYTRTLGTEKLLVVCNFTKEEVPYSAPEEYADAKVLIGNYERSGVQGNITLKPYEALVLKRG